jgi:hypothetical protein
MSKLSYAGMLCALIAVAGCGDEPSRSEAAAPGATYDVRISVVEKTEDGVDRLSAPRLVVLESQRASISVKDDKDGYSFECLVEQEQGKATVTTTGTIVRGGKTLATPTIRQFVGQPASIEINGLTIRVEAVEMKGT